MKFFIKQVKHIRRPFKFWLAGFFHNLLYCIVHTDLYWTKLPVLPKNRPSQRRYDWLLYFYDPKFDSRYAYCIKQAKKYSTIKREMANIEGQRDYEIRNGLDHYYYTAQYMLTQVRYNSEINFKKYYRRLEAKDYVKMDP